MPGKKNQSPTKPPIPIRWEFGSEIPTLDFFEHTNPENMGELDEAVDDFVYRLEKGDFLTWEAVVCEEQGLPLTAQQKKALHSLVSFSEEPDEQILYLNGLPRFSEPWHVILTKIVPHLLVEPFNTEEAYFQAIHDGWPHIAGALQKHGLGLSLPEGVSSPEEIVPAELRHKLWLQYCFDTLGGLGQMEELTLENAEQDWRIEEFMDRLRECRTSVAFLELTLESLLTRVILPEQDRPLFVQEMRKRLGLKSDQDRIADHL